MADTKISALTALPAASATAVDLIVVVDTSDTTMAASGTDKKMTLNDVGVALGPIMNGSIILLGFGWAGS